MSEHLKKFIAVLLLIGFIFPLNIHLSKNEIAPRVETAKPASAPVPLFETNPSLLGDEKITAVKTTGTLIESIKTAFETAKTALNTLDIFNLDWWIQYVFKIALEYFKLMVLNMMTDQIMSWINGANSSGPQFVTNWTNFLAKGASQARDSVISLVDQAFFAGKLCAPFDRPLRNFLRTPTQNYPSLNLQISCTLDKIVANVQSFYNNFANGGLAGYAAMIQPQNNYYGNIIQIMDYDAISKAAATKAKENEGLASQGFIGIKRCKLEEFNHETGEPTGNCLEYEITSPGKLAAGAVDRAVGNRFDYIGNAEQIASVVAIVVDGFINKLIGSGINGLLGFFSNAGASNPNTDTVFSQSLLQNSTGNGHLTQNQVPNDNFSNCDALPPGRAKDACLAANQAQGVRAFISASLATTNFPGQEVHIYWGSVNATSCASNQFNTAGRTSGDYIDYPVVDTNYTVTCTGQNDTASASTNVTVTGAGSAPVTFTADPNPITYGGASTLRWTLAPSVSLCTTSRFGSNLIVTSGSQSTGALTASKSYSIDCNMASGGVINVGVNVIVIPPVPTVTINTFDVFNYGGFGGDGSTVFQGGTTGIQWNSRYATSCTAFGGTASWSNPPAKAISGQIITDPLFADTAFSIQCFGPGGASNVTSAVVRVFY